MSDLFDKALKISQTKPMTRDILEILESLAKQANPEEERGMGMILEGAYMEFNDMLNHE